MDNQGFEEHKKTVTSHYDDGNYGTVTKTGVKPDLRRLSGFRRLRQSSSYRRNLLNTAWIWFSFLMFGWVYGQVGITLPDLQLLLDIDLETASWLFTSFSCGYMVGCMLAGVLSTRANPWLLLFIYTLGGAAFTTLIPWCPSLWLMILARLVQGLFIGAMDTSGHAELFTIWKAESGAYVQVMYFNFGLGGILVPYATEPFLAKVPPVAANVSGLFNASSSADSGQSLAPGDTKVQYAYIISGCLLLGAAVAFFMSYLNSRRQEDVPNKHSSTAGHVTAVRKQPSRFLFLLVLGTVSVMMLVVTGWIDTFAGYIMSFSLYQLGWTKTTGSLATSMFWVSFAMGNFLCIFLVQCLSTETLLFSFFSCSVVALSGLLLACLYGVEALVWLFLVLTGFSMSIMWPALFTWTEETVTSVTGRVASVFLVTGGVGFMVNPLAVGYLMDRYSNLWFVYIPLGEGVALFLMFLFVVLVYKRTKWPESAENLLSKRNERTPLVRHRSFSRSTL